jgi:hypothetical protein
MEYSGIGNWCTIEGTGLVQRRQIDDELPNGGTDTQIAPSTGAANSERQVLDWKM